MGGYGSGRNWESKRPIVERSFVLNVYELLDDANIFLSEGYYGPAVWTLTQNGRPFFHLHFSLINHAVILEYSVKGEFMKYSIRLDMTEQPNGGERYWFICPGRRCGRRAVKLYLPPGAEIFTCRICNNLTYKSCNDSHKFDDLYNHIASNLGMSLKEVSNAIKQLIKQGPPKKEVNYDS
jgi:hypothetical protein